MCGELITKLRQILQIVDILRAAAGFLIDLQMFKTDDVDQDIIDLGCLAFGKTLVEADSVDKRNDLKLERWDTHPNYAFRFHK